MSKKAALIATLPKSGTWYSHAFFWCYEQLLQHADEYLAGDFKPDLLTALNNKNIANVSTHEKTLGVDKLFICHAICPGFAKSPDARAALWEGMVFPLPYNWGETFVRNNGSWQQLDPAINPDARIVYLYRNPLDHFVSYYRHTQGHVDAGHRFRTLPDGTHIPIQNLQDFVFGAGMLGAFIKHYYSFRQMQQRYPGQVLLVPYEHLITNPALAFGNILKFLGSPPEGVLKERLFSDALMMCSRDSMMAIESRLTGSLAGDQIEGEKHIRDGKIGKWKKHFSDTDIIKIEAVFRLFGMTLLDFDLQDDNAADHELSWLTKIDATTLQEHQIAFLQQQLILTGTMLTHKQNTGNETALLTAAATKLVNLLRRSSLAPFLRGLKQKLRSLRSPQMHETGNNYTRKKLEFR